MKNNFQANRRANRSESTYKLAGTAILAALVMILQFFVIIPVGAFNITLTLVPIIIGAILFGAGSGAFLGFVFGGVVAIQVVTGSAGALSTLMFTEYPFITIFLCILKGTMAGLLPGIINGAMSKTKFNKLGTILSAISAPLVNTGIFVAGLYIFYSSLINGFIADNGLATTYADMTKFVFFGIVGLNFLVEFAVNVLLIPAIFQISNIVEPKVSKK
jgi:uncharacterized membrane protein